MLTEYTYVVNLLRGEIDNDGHEDREILNIFRPIIIKNISTAEVLDKLYERNVLNDQDREEIQSEIKRRGDIAAACMLLYKVPRREPDWFSIFVTVLRELKMDFLADQLDVPTHSKGLFVCIQLCRLFPFVECRIILSFRGKCFACVYCVYEYHLFQYLVQFALPHNK